MDSPKRISKTRRKSDDTPDGRLLLLSAADLRQVLDPTTALAAVARAYRVLGRSGATPPRALGFEIPHGSIHIKAGPLPGVARAFAAKINVNLPDNPRRGLPTIQGIVLLVDASDGRPLAAMDSRALTGLRTAAVAMLAARYGAPPGARHAALVGCGDQAGYMIEALAARYRLRTVRVVDRDRARAAAFARRYTARGIDCRDVADTAAAIAGAEICVTCTTSRTPVLTGDMDLGGCFVAAMGADNPKKREIDDATMARACVIVDDLAACAAGGELSHLAAGTPGRPAVELSALAAAGRPLARRPGDLVVFDSTGSGVQDAAAAWAAYRAATAAGVGTRFDLGGAAVSRPVPPARSRTARRATGSRR